MRNNKPTSAQELSEIDDVDTDDLKDNPDVLVIPKSNEIWYVDDNYYTQGSNNRTIQELPLGVYELQQTLQGFVLIRQYDNFTFPYKIYGSEGTMVNRVKHTFDSTTGNLGVLFNGTKGTGKTVTAKQICNNMQMPVIMVTKHYKGCESDINSINQDITVFVDEFEKIFREDSDILTIMDGALNSAFRRLFILTTNHLYINDNLKQRPGRVRYLKTFRDLDVSVTEELVDDLLIHKQFKSELMQFISSMEIITIDIVKSVIQEVNIHKEAPMQFAEFFNVKKITGKYNIFLLDENNKEVPLFLSVGTNMRNFDSYNDDEDGFNLYINNIGYINLDKALTNEVFEATIQVNDSIYESHRATVLDKLKLIGKKVKKRNYTEQVILKVEAASMYNIYYKNNKNFSRYLEVD